MKHKLIIEFRDSGDCEWALKMIARAQKFTREAGPGGGTPLEGGAAAILLSALGRAEKVTSKSTTPKKRQRRSLEDIHDEAEAMTVGKTVPELLQIIGQLTRDLEDMKP